MRRPACFLAQICAGMGILGACGPSFEPSLGSRGEDGQSVEQASSSGIVDEATTRPDASDTEAIDEAETDEGSGGEPHPGSGFIRDPDGEHASHECDLWSQDCPPGEKCNTWANDGGNAWNATKCVPIDPDPDDIGEPCTVTGSGVSGVDSCVLGAMCWSVDPETNEGECFSFCRGSENDPFCPDPETTCNGGREFALCVDSCCPLEQDCGHDEMCVPVIDSFQCAPDASGEMGAFGDPCEYINACDPGLTCAIPVAVPDCTTAGCCTPMCAVGTPHCAAAHPDLECVPYFEDGQAPPGFEEVGICLLPS